MRQQGATHLSSFGAHTFIEATMAKAARCGGKGKDMLTKASYPAAIPDGPQINMAPKLLIRATATAIACSSPSN